MSATALSNMFAKIMNAQRASHRDVSIKYSKFKLSVLELLKAEGFVSSVVVLNDKDGETVHPTIKVGLKYYEGDPVISGVQMVSKPSLKVYTSIDNVKRVKNGLGLMILSTSSGVLSDRKAKELRVGGEVLCTVY
jgi:small subunit ribosomal protein S8